MKANSKATIRTVNDLRDWLNEQEKDFNEKGMGEMFGEFGIQELLMPHVTNDGTCKGYGEFQAGYSADGVYMVFDWEAGNT